MTAGVVREGVIQRVAVVGAGVIGLSWATQFLAAGLDVTVWDPDPGIDTKLAAALATAGVEAGAATRVRVCGTVAEAVADAQFVQESGPERLEVKQELFTELDATPADAVIASSSSGLTASQIQATCATPERVVIGHPFHPPHLIPVVEVVGGTATEAWAVDEAVEFYARIGKRPIKVRTELPGHIVNRLQAALWREAYWLVREGAASVADIDTAIAYGPGLRWSLLGPFATQHLSGGDAGLAHVLEHLGPPMVDWWHTFETPPLDQQCIDAAVSGVDAELDGIDQAAMVAERDALLEQLLALKSNAQHLPD